MTLLRILLAPFTLLHAAVLRIRHLLYDTGVIRPVRPAIPTSAKDGTCSANFEGH